MFLEGLVVEGFKSYSLATEMNFNPGIGVVIGNNGVGKSNIMDAISWGLGDNALARLRCYGQEDLFFSGSKDYPPAPAARVLLTLSQGPEKDAPRIHLERRMTRSGEDHYAAANNPVSREAYLNRLKDLGLVDTLKTLIRQEQLNDWLRIRSGGTAPGRVSFSRQWDKTFRGRQFIRGWDKGFRHYFTTLLPEGDGRLYVEDSNGAKGLEIEIRFSG